MGLYYKDKEVISFKGTSFTAMLAIVFITLKLLHKIDWSWWWVLAPLWAPLALILIFVMLVIGVTIIEEINKALKKGK